MPHYQNRGPTPPPPQPANAPQVNLTDLNPLDVNDLGQAFGALNVQPETDNQWFMDSGATNHMTSDAGMVTIPSSVTSTKSIYVGNGQSLPIQGSGNTSLPSSSKPLHLKNVLFSPQIIKNLISIRQFTTDNWVSYDFDPFGFSVKDYQTGKILSRHDSTSHLYSFTYTSTASAFVADNNLPWHARLGHPGHHVMDYLRVFNFIPCNKTSSSTLCQPCQLSKHKRLPFHESQSITYLPFDIIHCDLWTYPLLSHAGYKYYMVLIDDKTQYTWVFPLKYKSETFTKFAEFHKYI